MKWGDLFIILVLLGVLGGSGWFIYTHLPGTPILLEVHNPDKTTQAPVSKAVQFYPSMRFPDRTIKYTLESRCSERKRNEMIAAFDYLQERTILNFVEGNDPQIIVTCSNLAPEPALEGHFVAGEGGPTEILNTSLYSVILEGKIALYKADNCDSPHVALHELLHALGFDHVNNEGSIMYPTLDCDQILDPIFLEELNELYADDNLPDLLITHANATKSGAYLAFSVEVANQGLAPSDEVTLRVIADGEVIKSFNLEELEIGTKKILSVENLRIPRSAQTIRFSVESATSERELTMDNNELELSVTH